jgi:type IV pilus assembly protein PilB
MINGEQANAALHNAEQEDTDVVEILARDTELAKIDVVKALAAQFGMETVSLSGVNLEPDVLATVPGQVANRYRVVPVGYDEATVTVAISDPFDVETLDSLRYVLKKNVEGVVALKEDIDVALTRYYPQTDADVDSILSEIGADDKAASALQKMLGDSGEVTEADEPIIKLVNLIIIEAFRQRASDIHLEPLERKFRVRYRIDGVLREVDSPPKRLQSAIISRVKIMSNMSIAEKRVPQDGRIEIKVMERDLDLRVSVMPSNHGETVVMRILDKESLMLGLPQLGFFSDDQSRFEGLVKLSDGIILVTGPTGSGKTTTLYACLNTINTPDRKIITVEDPVEYQLSGINQVHVRADIGLTFGAALRSILRQAPNVIMIGEIRDLETAEIAINASLTGHLVFSTLHTNDAPSAVTRLIDIGVKPFLVASSVRSIMAQRLVRKICPRCKEEYKPTDLELSLLGPAAEQISSTQLYRGAGCGDCSGTGYRGRIGLFEICMINQQLQNMIFEGLSSVELRVVARELGMRTLREDGLRKVVAGHTTLEEVLRVTMKGDD